MAFAEDKHLIEAQQRVINLDPDWRELLTSADAGPTRAAGMEPTHGPRIDCTPQPFGSALLSSHETSSA
jgi:hypothetical protein